MARVRSAALLPAQRSNGLSPAAGAPAGAGVVMVNPAGRSAWARSARWASASGDSPPGAGGAGAGPVVVDGDAAAVTVVDGSAGGDVPVSGLVRPGITV